MSQSINPLLHIGVGNLPWIIGILQCLAGAYVSWTKVPKQLWMFLAAPGLVSLLFAMTLSDFFGTAGIAPGFASLSMLVTAYGSVAVVCDRDISENVRDVIGGLMVFAFFVYAALSAAMPADLSLFDWDLWRTINSYSLTIAWVPLAICIAAIAAFTLRTLGIIGEVRQFNEDDLP